MTPEIKTIEPINVISVRKTGLYSDSAERAWGELCAFAGSAGLIKPEAKKIGVSLDNLDITGSDKLRYDACLSVDEKIQTPGNIIPQEIEGGLYAVFVHKGPYENLIETYHGIFGIWLPASGSELRELPSFEQYVNDPDSVDQNELITDIYIPKNKNKLGRKRRWVYN